MLIGYTLFDPLLVVCGTILAAFLLVRNPLRLLYFLPMMLSLWFFVPLITNLTLWQTVPLLLIAYCTLKSPKLPGSAFVLVSAVIASVVLSAAYAFVNTGDPVRIAIRLFYYLSSLAVFFFCYEMGRRPHANVFLLRGCIFLGVVFSIYGFYQIVAYYTGLPVRGIVYSAGGGSVIADEGGFPRINSLANEPKRLGYVLFIASMAAIFFKRSFDSSWKYTWRAGYIFFASLLTFSGSYFLAIFLFITAYLVIYPSRASKYLIAITPIGFFLINNLLDMPIFEVLETGFLRRLQEFEVGLDGAVVYRQEFYILDYFYNNPSSIFTGVGLGQYYYIMHDIYGTGAGIHENGSLMSANSNVLELILDMGLIGPALFYLGLAILVFRLRRERETFLCLGLLFLVIQSFMLVTLSFIAVFAGVGLGRLAYIKKRNLETAREA